MLFLEAVRKIYDVPCESSLEVLPYRLQSGRSFRLGHVHKTRNAPMLLSTGLSCLRAPGIRFSLVPDGAV